jgi:hypothetical protein
LLSAQQLAFVWNDQYLGFAVGSFGMCIDADEEFSGGGGGFSSYVFYDGTKLAFSRARFDSVRDAERCFQSDCRTQLELLSEKLYLMKRTRKSSANGLFAIFPPDEYAKTEWTRIMSLDGDRIVEITSPSLRHALNFEKRNRKY